MCYNAIDQFRIVKNSKRIAHDLLRDPMRLKYISSILSLKWIVLVKINYKR